MVLHCQFLCACIRTCMRAYLCDQVKAFLTGLPLIYSCLW